MINMRKLHFLEFINITIEKYINLVKNLVSNYNTYNT